MSIVSDTATHAPFNGTLYIRIDPQSNLNDKIQTIKKIYENYTRETPFSYYFLDDAFDDLQKGENHLARVFGIFTFIALCIACMGLFGLIAFTAERRTKEISIRKVFGASTQNILAILSSDLIRLLLLGIFIGTPIAWLVMKNWLSSFFYRANIPISIVIIPGIMLMVLSLIIIGTNCFKVAAENPAKHIRNE